MRVLKWIVERSTGHGFAYETPMGWVPRYQDIDWTGLDFTEEQFAALMKINNDRIKYLTLSDEQLFLQLHDRMPLELMYEKQLLVSRL